MDEAVKEVLCEAGGPVLSADLRGEVSAEGVEGFFLGCEEGVEEGCSEFGGGGGGGLEGEFDFWVWGEV